VVNVTVFSVVWEKTMLNAKSVLKRRSVFMLMLMSKRFN